MNISEMRAAIMQVYPSQKWYVRVMNMPENQVIAIYRSFEANGKFRPLKTNHPASNIIRAPQEEPHQMTIQEWAAVNGIIF